MKMSCVFSLSTRLKRSKNPKRRFKYMSDFFNSKLSYQTIFVLYLSTKVSLSCTEFIYYISKSSSLDGDTLPIHDSELITRYIYIFFC